MELMDQIEHFEREFPCLYTNVMKKSYGILYYNALNPISHDSNHAIISNENHLEQTLKDIITFYQKHHITPRIYSSMIEGQLDRIRNEVVKKNGCILIDPADYYLCTKPSIIENSHRLEIRRIQDFDDFHIEALLDQEEQEYLPAVLKRCASNPDVHILVGYLHNTPVSMAVLQYSKKWNICRVDDVKTAKAYQNRGYAREMIDYLIRYHATKYQCPLYLYSNVESAIKIYKETGFTKIDKNYERWAVVFSDC